MAEHDQTLEKRLSNLEQELKKFRNDSIPVATVEDIKGRVNEISEAYSRIKAGADKRAEILKRGGLRDGRSDVRFLMITNRLARPDELATDALSTVRKKRDGGYKEALALIQNNGLATAMERVTSRVNASALDETARFLLASPDIYGALVAKILKSAGAVQNGIVTERPRLEKFVADTVAFTTALRQELDGDGGPRHDFLKELATAALKRNGVDFKDASPRGIQLIAELRARPVPLSVGRPQVAIEALQDAVIADGDFPSLVDAYAAIQEIDEDRFTPEVRRAMVRHLIARGITIPLDATGQNQKFLEGGYDEYFALAYEQAVAAAAGDDDPIDGATTKGASIAPWDFTVDTFESVEEQGVIKENLLAAGALDYVYELGERMGVFRLLDALTLNWAAGAIDVVEGPCAARLYRYWKLRDQRSDPAERGLVYKRVLDKGDAEVLERMVVNEAFPALWGTLMQKTTEYIQKIETAKAESGEALLVSRTPIHQAVRELQHNLTEFCTGMAHMQVREMYSQLREAMEILGEPEIVDHVAGGRRKNVWTVIERLSKSEFGEAPNISAIRTAAVEGNAVFRYIANFQQGAVQEDEFQRFLSAAEAWIIAKGSDSDDVASIVSTEETNGDLEDLNDDDF